VSSGVWRRSFSAVGPAGKGRPRKEGARRTPNSQWPPSERDSLPSMALALGDDTAEMSSNFVFLVSSRLAGRSSRRPRRLLNRDCQVTDPCVDMVGLESDIGVAGGSRAIGHHPGGAQSLSAGATMSFCELSRRSRPREHRLDLSQLSNPLGEVDGASATSSRPQQRTSRVEGPVNTVSGWPSAARRHGRGMRAVLKVSTEVSNCFTRQRRARRRGQGRWAKRAAPDKRGLRSGRRRVARWINQLDDSYVVPAFLGRPLPRAARSSRTIPQCPGFSRTFHVSEVARQNVADYTVALRRPCARIVRFSP